MYIEIKGVCFDLDQTLCNSEDFQYSSKQAHRYKKTAEWQIFKYLKEEFDILDWERFQKAYKLAKEQVKEHIPNSAASHSRYLYLQRTFENLGMRFNPDLVYRASNVYWKYVIGNMQLFPKVLDVLKVLKENHLKVCIVTDLTADIQNRKLRKLKIEKYVDYMVTSEESGADKPNTEMLNLALEKMDLKRNEILIVGNNPKTDIQLAKNINVKSVLFDYYGVHAEGERNSPDHYITDFSQLLTILNIKRTEYSAKKVIVFDMLGTLTTNAHLVSSILTKLLPDRKRDDIKREYELYKVGKISGDEFWKRLNVDNPATFERGLFSKIRLRKGVMALLDELSRKYDLAILSNIPKEWGASISKKFSFDKYFKEILFSGDYKIMKPDPRIYKILLKKFPDVNPQNIYFVDDDLGDLESGKNLLMQTFWLKSDQKSGDFIPDHTLNSLSQVREHFLKE